MHALVVLPIVLVHAFAPTLPTHLHASPSSRTAVHPPPLMALGQQNSNPDFDQDAVDPEAVRKTITRQGFVLAGIGGLVAVVRCHC